LDSPELLGQTVHADRRQLRSLRLDGMLAALNDPAKDIATSELSFEQCLSLLVQREVDWHDGKDR